MAGHSVSSLTAIIIPSIPTGPLPPRDIGKAIMTESATPPTISTSATSTTSLTRSYLSKVRQTKLYDSLMTIVPCLENGASYDDHKLNLVMRRIKQMLEKANKYGAYFGVKPWESKPKPVSPAINFDFGINPRAVFFPMYPENKSNQVWSLFKITKVFVLRTSINSFNGTR